MLFKHTFENKHLLVPEMKQFLEPRNHLETTGKGDFREQGPVRNHEKQIFAGPRNCSSCWHHNSFVHNAKTNIPWSQKL